MVADSSCCLPEALLRKWNITVVPHELIIGHRSLRDGVDIGTDEFYRLLRDGRTTPTTAAPKPQDFLDGYLAAGQLAPNVLCLTLSASFSAAYLSARSALEMANGKLSDTRVEIVDSHAAAGASGLIALAAAGWASQGLGLDQIVAKVGELIPKVHLIAFLDSLWYLSRSGRVGKFDALAGTLLSVKPLAELRMGVARILEKPRSRAKAVERLLATMGQRLGSSPSPIVVNIMEANSPEDAFALSRRIRNEFDCADWFISQLTPVMGVHTGPGLLGVAFHEAIPS